MGNRKLADDAPCPSGHTAGRDKWSRCRECVRIRERARERKPQRYLREAGAGWVLAAQRNLRRMPGERASCRQLFDLWLAQGRRCALTGLPVDKPHLDHIVPVAVGGSSRIDNLQWVHPMANSAKRDNSTSEFRAWLLAAADSLKAKMEFEALL